MTETTQDIAIIGGGIVGSSLALALADKGWRVTLIEQRQPKPIQQNEFSPRTVAITETSARLFQALGVWQAMEAFAHPIAKIHVSNRKHFGITRLQSKDLGLAHLGYVFDVAVLSSLLLQQAMAHPHIRCDTQTTLQTLQLTQEQVQVNLLQQQQVCSLNAKLIIAADGSHSQIRQLLHEQSRVLPYHQCAIVSRVTSQRCHGGIAYERFTENGPIALLPYGKNHSALVWSVNTAEADTLMKDEDDIFLGKLQQAFGYRLGKFTHTGTRGKADLCLHSHSDSPKARLIYVGNSYTTLHPLAAQGLNLGLRSLAHLAQTLGRKTSEHSDPGEMSLVEQYYRTIASDNQQTTGFTHGLVRLFASEAPHMSFGRNLGMTLMDMLPASKSWLLRRAMGIHGQVPDLIRGITTTREHQDG